MKKAEIKQNGKIPFSAESFHTLFCSQPYGSSKRAIKMRYPYIYIDHRVARFVKQNAFEMLGMKASTEYTARDL